MTGTQSYKQGAHKGQGQGTRTAPVCGGRPADSELSYARQTLAAAHPDWTLMRVHDRAIILAVKMRVDGFPRISQGG